MAAASGSEGSGGDRFRHDLRSSLALISGMAETLEAAWERLPDADRSVMLASIRSQAASASKLLDEGLDPVRPEQPAS